MIERIRERIAQIKRNKKIFTRWYVLSNITTTKDHDEISSIYGFWLFNIITRRRAVNIYSSIIPNVKIIKFLIRILNRINSTLKKKIFLLHTLIVALSKLLFIISNYNTTLNNKKRIYDSLSKRIYLFITLCYVHITKFQNVYLKNNKLLFYYRLPYFHLYSKILTCTLFKTTFIPNNREVIIRFFGLHFKNINAHTLLNYFITKLREYNTLSQIMYPIISRMKRAKIFEGFRFTFAGRLTRRERAAYIVKERGSMPFSTHRASIDYASGFVILKFGVVGIKIHLRKLYIIPYYYFFEFRNRI